MIKELQKSDSIIGIINTIKKYFSEYDQDIYLPAIIKEGDFMYERYGNKKKRESSDFYAKLIIRPISSKITHSWLIQNMVYNFYNGNEYSENKIVDPLDFVYNIIVHKNVYGNFIYTLNPMLYNDESSISEENYKNNGIANLYYCDSYHSENKINVLKNENDDIYILKEVLENYVFAQNPSRYGNGDYILSVEFEYRNTNNHIKDVDNYQDDTSFIDNINKEKKDYLWLIGTIDIPFVIKSEQPLNIVVNDLKGNKRTLNENNYNDDTDAGLIVFSEDCFEYLRQRYIILGLTMIDTYNENQSYIIDNLEDIFVFWEGEFNKLPREVKVGLEKYNNIEKSTGIVSPAMFEWQLNANWDWKNKAYPSQYLGEYLIENYIELVKEYKCNIVLPKNEEIFKEQINNILEILNIKIEDVYKNENGYRAVLEIMNQEKKEKNKEILKSLFEYFCSIVLEKVDKNYVRTIHR